MAARMATEEEARSDWLGAKAPEPPCSDGPLRRCLDAVVQEGCQTKHRCRRDDDPREGAYLCAVDAFLQRAADTCGALAQAAAGADRGLEVEAVPEPTDAVTRAVGLAGEDGLVVVAGTFYIVSPARRAVFALGVQQGREEEEF